MFGHSKWPDILIDSHIPNCDILDMCSCVNSFFIIFIHSVAIAKSPQRIYWCGVYTKTSPSQWACVWVWCSSVLCLFFFFFVFDMAGGGWTDDWPSVSVVIYLILHYDCSWLLKKKNKSTWEGLAKGRPIEVFLI